MIVQPSTRFTGHKSSIYKIIGYDDTSFLSTGGDGFIVKWKADGSSQDGIVIALIDHQIFSMALVSQNLLVTGGMNGHLYWIDLENSTTIKNIKHHQKGIYDIIYQGEHLYTGGGDGMVTKWNVQTMYPEESIKVSNSAVRRFFHLEQNIILVGCSDGNIYALNMESMQSQRSMLSAHESSVFCITGDQKHIYSGGRDAHINSYDRGSFDKIQSVPAHWFTVNDLLLIPDLECLVSASRDKKVRLWNCRDLQLIQSIDIQSGGHHNSVNTLLYHRDMNRLFSAGDDRIIIEYKTL